MRMSEMLGCLQYTFSSLSRHQEELRRMTGPGELTDSL